MDETDLTLAARGATPSVESAPLALARGQRLWLRPITPASKPLIAAALRRMSPESIRRRFFAPRRELSEIELDRLTAVDGWDRYAIGACTTLPDGAVEGVAVARYARLADDDGTAEIAVTVVDAYQGRGVGTGLLARLFAAARLRGVRRLSAIALPENEPVQRLLARFVPGVRWRRDGLYVTTRFGLDAVRLPELS